MHFLAFLSALILTCLAQLAAGQWTVTNSGSILLFQTTNGTLNHVFDVQLFTGVSGFVEVLSFPDEGNGVTLEFKHRLLSIVEIAAGSYFTPTTVPISTFNVSAWNNFAGSSSSSFEATSIDPFATYEVTAVPELAAPFYSDPANITFNLSVPKASFTSRIGFLTLASVGERVNGNYVSASFSFQDV